jgi:hypothetical protein
MRTRLLGACASRSLSKNGCDERQRLEVLYYSAFFNPAKTHARRCDFANPACIRSNCTMYWGGILDRQMHRGLVHALDRYY